MSEHTIKMPDVGEGVTEAEIVAWHVSPGDMVEEDQDLVDVMTDKATVEIPSPVSGKIVSISGDPGDMISVGSPIIVIETDEAVSDSPEEAEVSDNQTEKTAEPAEPQSPSAQDVSPSGDASSKAGKLPHHVGASVPNRANTKVLASPAVRQRALELDVELSSVVGSGPAGQILREDLDDFVSAGGRAIARSSAPTGRQKRTGEHTTNVIGLRRKIAQNMEKAWSVPMITYVEEIDVTELEALRKSLNASRQDDRAKLTLLPFLGRAIVKAVSSVPHTNAHYRADEGSLTEFEAVHLGIATATDKGLVVPVLKHSEAMTVWDMASEIKRLSAAARDGKAGREEITGSTITITSLGAIGGLVTTPILNTPETSIVGVNKIVERPVFDGGGRVVPRLFMNLSSSFDHRIVDGYEAAQFVQKIRAYLETPATLFMEEDAQ